MSAFVKGSTLVFSLSLAAAAWAGTASGYLTINGSAWRLALADVNGDGRGELIFGTYQGTVGCLDPARGRLLWEARIGGFPFAIAAADVDGDGRAEAFAAAADGKVHAFGPDGRRLWTFGPTNAPMNAVAMCRRGPDEPPAILCGGFSRALHALAPDGVSVWREGGPKLTGGAAADALRQSFEADAAKLPFRPLGDDVFFHTIEVSQGRYRLFAIDPGWLDPADRHISVQVQLPGAWRLTDVLSGAPVPVEASRARLVVPAGALRILDATRP